jgi:hypothetical protein
MPQTIRAINEKGTMTSFATIRDPPKDQLLTSQNSVLVIIDYQPVQVSSVASRSKREPVANITARPASASSTACRSYSSR